MGVGDPNYFKKVYDIYKRGTDQQGKKLWVFVLLTSLLLTASSMILNTALAPKESITKAIKNPLARVDVGGRGEVLGEQGHSEFPLKILTTIRLDDQNSLAFIGPTLYPALGLAIVDNSDDVEYFLEGGELTAIFPYGVLKGPGEYTDWLEIEDINNDGVEEIAIQYIVSGTGLRRPFYLYQKESGVYKLILKLDHGVSQARLVNLDGDAEKEIHYSYALDASGAGPRYFTKWEEVWDWQGGKLVKANNKFPNVFKQLNLFYDSLLTNSSPETWLSYYLPMVKCLKEQSDKNLLGVLADGEICNEKNPWSEVLDSRE